MCCLGVTVAPAQQHEAPCMLACTQVKTAGTLALWPIEPKLHAAGKREARQTPQDDEEVRKKNAAHQVWQVRCRTCH